MVVNDFLASVADWVVGAGNRDDSTLLCCAQFGFERRATCGKTAGT
ncbi:MAG: hypothetical protein ACJAVI_003623 [Candidatus Azotimanducaceae bacterium]|jgi:hypothetical protein